MVDGWSWYCRPKGSDQAASGQPSPLPLHSWLPPMVFLYSNQRNFSHATTTGSRTGVDLEVVLFIRIPCSRLTLGPLTRWRHVPQWWGLIKDQDVDMSWYQDEVHRSRALPSFLDINSVEHEAINVCTAQDEEKHPKDYFRTNISHQECLFKEFYAIGLTRRPSFIAKVGRMVLNSILESTQIFQGRW